jgi:hypothetical protein
MVINRCNDKPWPWPERGFIRLPLSVTWSSAIHIDPSGYTLHLMDDHSIDLLAEALGSVAMNSASGLGPTNRPRQLFERNDVSSLAKYIKSGACKKIYLMVNTSQKLLGEF